MWARTSAPNWRSWRTFDAGGHVSISGHIDRTANTLVFHIVYRGTITLYSHDGLLLAGAHVEVPDIAGRFDMIVGLSPITGEEVLALHYSFRSGPQSYAGETQLIALVRLFISLCVYRQTNFRASTALISEHRILLARYQISLLSVCVSQMSALITQPLTFRLKSSQGLKCPTITLV